MACCKCCCGGEDCTEGQEGKCCCGGSSGTCCDVGEYCCSGVCSAEPCGCPTGGLCDCTGGFGVPPLFVANWPGELVPSLVVDCDVVPPYYGNAAGSFTCAGSGTCYWTVTVEADITCATIDPGTQCGSDCTLSNVTITVDDSLCDCPGELPDTSTFEYFYCA